MGSASDRAWTVGDLLNWTRAHFRDGGLDSPRLTAELLLSHALGCRRIDLYARFDETVDEAGRARFRDLVRRRDARVPVAYLTGTAHFLTLEVQVDERVMAPRPETETLVTAFADRVAAAGTVADVGTGSGVIAIALARRHADLRVAAIDVSADALAVARENVARYGLADRVTLIEGDLLAPLMDGASEREIAAVVANPPYVSEADLAAAEPEVREHEPRIALDGGPDGLRVIRRLIEQAPRALAGGGWLLMEIGAGQADAVQNHLEQQGAWQGIARVRDYGGHERVIVARLRGRA